MSVFTQVQQMLNDGKDEEIIKLCIGQDSELSKEVAKNVMGKQTTNLRNIMSNLRRGIIYWGNGKKKVKDLTDIEHVDEVKKRVKFVLNYYTMNPTSAETQEQAIEKHIDNMNSHDTTHDQLDTLVNLLDPTQQVNAIKSMPTETAEQKYKFITAARKNVRELQSAIAIHKPDADEYLAAKKQNISMKTISLCEQAEGSVDLLTDKHTIDTLDAENNQLKNKMKINNMAKAKMKKAEQKINPVPKKQSKRSAPTNEIKSKK